MEDDTIQETIIFLKEKSEYFYLNENLSHFIVSFHEIRERERIHNSKNIIKINKEFERPCPSSHGDVSGEKSSFNTIISRMKLNHLIVLIVVHGRKRGIVEI